MQLAEKQAWCTSFFNTIEYLCFLMNNDMVPSVELHKFFDMGIAAWWKQFTEYVGEGLIRDNENMFGEFKKVCKRLKLDAT